MELQEIDVFIERNGEVRLEVRGAKGSHCLTLTRDLEELLGGKIAARELTPEASENPVSEVQSVRERSRS